jgi:manganese transport protein
MEGFLQLKVRPWLRRLITRSLAIVPAALVIALNTSGGAESQNHAVYQLLLFSQVVLSVQLSFATIPLVLFTGKSEVMGRFVNPRWLKVLAWTAVIAIAALNAYLLITEIF